MKKIKNIHIKQEFRISRSILKVEVIKMKKINAIIILLILLLHNQSVKALSTTYYSEYGNFSSWTEEPILKTDINKVEIERRYQWYKEATILGDYYKEGENDLNYPLINKKDLKKSEWTDWSKNAPKEEPNREINTKKFYEYQNMKKVRYLHLDQFEGSNNQLDIIELELKINGQEIEYDAVCEKCSPEWIEIIKNHNTLDSENKIDYDDYVRIDLKDWYVLDQIEFTLYLKDQTEHRKSYHYYYTANPEKDARIYAENIYYHWFQTAPNETHQIIRNAEDLALKDPEWLELQISEEYIEPSLTRQVQETTYYQYQDTMYRYYKTERTYAKNYSKDGYTTYPIKDTGNYKDYYREQKRDKVVIDSHIVITSSKSKLEDFITETTTKQIKIEGNYDLKKNGTYQVQFVLPFKTVKRTIYVDLSQQNELQEENKKLKKEIDEWKKQISKTNSNTEQIANIKNNQLKESFHQQNTNWMLKQLESEKQKTKNVDQIDYTCEDTISTIEKKSSFHYLILLLLLPLSILYKKIRTKNVELK